MRLRTSPKSLLKTVWPRTNASVPRLTSAKRSSKTFPIVSVSTSVPAMNATPSVTASAVVNSRSFLASRPLIVTRHMRLLLPEALHPIEHTIRSRLQHLVHDLAVGEEDHSTRVRGRHRVVGDHDDRLREVGDGLLH